MSKCALISRKRVAVIGIDLGTSYCVRSWVEPRPVAMKTVGEPSRDGSERVFISSSHEDICTLSDDLVLALRSVVPRQSSSVPRMEILVSRSEDLRSNWIKFICDQLGRIIFDKRAYLDDPKLLIILPKCDEAASKRKTDMDGDGFSDLMEMGIADSALRNNIAHLLYRATQLIPIEDIAVSRLRTVAEYVARWDSPNTYLADQQRFDLVSFGSSVSCIHPRIFLVNRLLSFPEARIRKRRLGLTRIGGYLEALETVWNLIEHCWVILASRHDCLHLDLGKTKDLSRFTILKGIARALAIEIEVAPDSALNACLVKTKRSTTIYVDSGLNMWDRSFYIAHELAHYVLRHRTIDPSAEAHPQYIEQQHHQEQEADALADVMMHVTDGLYDLSRAKADPEAGESAPRTGTVFSDR